MSSLTLLLLLAFFLGALSEKAKIVIEGVASMDYPVQCPECPKTIPPGYKKYGDLGYYKFHSTPMNWFDAKATCEREGAYLVVINSKEEASLIVELNNGRTKWTLIGMHDQFELDNFYTILDEPLKDSGYTNWKEGEPNSATERCGALSEEGELNDYGCAYTRPFACELFA